jgi:hypothetical protein
LARPSVVARPLSPPDRATQYNAKAPPGHPGGAFHFRSSLGHAALVLPRLGHNDMRLRTGIRENIDALTGLKENVIGDCLIPAGTGAGICRLRVAAASRDAVRSVLQTEG